MSATITLPLALRTRLAAIRRRARLLRSVRGLGLLILVLGLAGAAALLADYWLDLPAIARQILFCVWIVVGGGLLLFGVVVPLCRRIDAAALAAVIEEKYPDLGERLTSAVELAETPTEGHGSPVLIALLMDEAEKQSSRLDFRPAVPARRAGVLAALAAVVVLLVAAPAFVWPQTYADLTQRFLRPWYAAPVPAPYTLEVTPGDAIAARGRSITLSAHLTPRDETIALPASSTLVVVSADGKETRQAMERAGSGDFTIAYKVSGDVSYRIEAEQAVSDSYRLTSIAPVELAADNPTITVTPPAYARAAMEEETFRGLVDLSPLRHSEIRFDFRFTRPAVAAHLEWIAENKSAKVIRHPLTLNDDRQAGAFTLPATAEGTYRVVLEAEHGIQTVLPGGTIHVRPDQPPSVLKFAGKEDRQAVLPYERIPLELEATDDIAVAGVELEYRVNDGEAVRQPLTLQGGGTPSALARHVLELADKVKENDRFHYRFHVSDNLPKEYKGPNVIVYPPDRWLTLQVARRGTPLKQQEILAQHNEINQKLEAIKAALVQEKRGLFKVLLETRKLAELPPDQVQQLRQLQQDNRGNQKALRDVAQTADTTPALHPLAELARAVADQEMSASQKALEQAPRQSSPPERTRQLDKADEQLASAVKRLDELKKVNDALARERLDQAKLEMLADREKHLAEQAAEVAAKHPILDPTVKPQSEKIKREQAEGAAELERLAQQSEPLKKALDLRRAEQARRMAERARELAQAQRDLARAEAETERQRNAGRLAELARKQQELAEREAKLARQTRQPSLAAQTTPLKPEEAQRAADALKQGDAQEAVKHQDQAIRDLERLAQAFERAVQVSADPKEAARQLAQAEKALRQRVQEEMAKKDGKQGLAERLKPLREEQKAIQQAAEQLSVPPSNLEANKVKRQIAEHAGQAEEALQKSDAPRAQAKMEETRNQLSRLADLLPRLEQRRQQAQNEVARLRRQQEDIARQVDSIKKDDPQTARRLEEAARRQAEVAEALSKMDAPKQEARQERTTEAVNRALADLMDRRREDATASQQEARRQLERLEQSLRGQKPADEQARELAREQRELAQETARAAADPKATPQQKQEIQRKQQQVAAQTRSLQAPEAPQRQREAAEATREAAKAAQTQPTAAATQQRMQEAARKLDELARQMAGEQTDAARAERPIQSPKQTAQQMAARQRDLAKATQQAANQNKGQTGKEAMQKIAQQQRELNRQASHLPANQAQRGLEQARAAMNRAEQALERKEATQAQQQQTEAANALERLAKRLPAEAPATARREPQESPNAPQGLPRKEQSEQARQLARQQRELRDAVQRADQTARAEQAVVQDNPAGELARQQAEIAKQTAELSRNVGQEQGKDSPVSQQAQQAQQAAQKAARHLAAGALPQAREAGQQTAEQLRKLASQLARTPQGNNAQAPDVLQQARKLGQRQEAINRRMQPLADDARVRAAQQQSQQRHLQQEAGELMQQFQRTAQQTRNSPPAQMALQRAANASQQAQQTMQQARNQAQQGQSAPQRQSQERAAQALDQAAREATQAASLTQQASAKPGSPKSGSESASQPGTPKTGEAMAQAQQHMNQAQGQLNQGQHGQAQATMRQAAQSLAQAAQRMAAKPQPGQPGQTTGQGRLAGGLPDLSAYGLDKTPNAGKSWGELPGELRTKIVQDMKAHYGEDYARMIKYYFEQIASTNPPTNRPLSPAAGPPTK